MVTKKDKSEYLVKSLGNAIEILELIAQSKSGVSETEITEALSFSASKTKNLLQTLENYGYIESNINTEKYTIGIKMFQISSVYFSKIDVISVITRDLEELLKDINETIFVSMLRKGSVVYMHYLETSKSVRVATSLGNLRYAYTTACGKAQLAHRSIDYSTTYFGEGFTKFTDKTISNIEDLETELKRIKKQGYSISVEEYNQGILEVGAPILNFLGKPIAGISVHIPIFRMTPAKAEQVIAPKLLDVSRKLSGVFGYKG